MSGPCTDCGGPDYQTLLARIAELGAENGRLKKYTVGMGLSGYAAICAERDDLLAELAAKQDTLDDLAKTTREYVEYAEAENTELRKQNEILATTRRLEEEARQQAEAERDAKATAYTNTLECLGRQAETIWKLKAELARVQSYMAQGKGLALIEEYEETP